MKRSIFFYLILTTIVLAESQQVSPSNFAQVETPIAVNPTNEKNIIIASISIVSNTKFIGVYYTLDGGLNWTGNDQIFGDESCDPCFSSDGTPFLCFE